MAPRRRSVPPPPLALPDWPRWRAECKSVARTVSFYVLGVRWFDARAAAVRHLAAQPGFDVGAASWLTVVPHAKEAPAGAVVVWLESSPTLPFGVLRSRST